MNPVEVAIKAQSSVVSLSIINYTKLKKRVLHICFFIAPISSDQLLLPQSKFLYKLKVLFLTDGGNVSFIFDFIKHNSKLFYIFIFLFNFHFFELRHIFIIFGYLLPCWRNFAVTVHLVVVEFLLLFYFEIGESYPFTIVYRIVDHIFPSLYVFFFRFLFI